MSDLEGKKEELMLFGFNFSRLSSFYQFIVSSTLIFIFYLAYGFLQELIFKYEGVGPFSWYICLVQFILYTFFGLIECGIRTRCGTLEGTERRIPMRTYTIIAFLSVATMGLSNQSVVYLNYPTQVVFKCCKLIPVLIGGILIQHKAFNLFDLIGCGAMSLGLIIFTLADNQVQPNFNVYGVVLVSLALVADAAIGNVQERAMREHQATSSEVVLYSYSIGAVYIFVGLIAVGTLVPAIHFFAQHLQLYSLVALFSLTGYLGVSFVMLLIKTHGALVGVTVTTARKAVSILLSFLVFVKPFTVQYLIGGFFVVLGIYLNTISKNSQQLKNAWDRIARLFMRRKLPAAQADHIV